MNDELLNASVISTHSRINEHSLFTFKYRLSGTNFIEYARKVLAFICKVCEKLVTNCGIQTSDELNTLLKKLLKR